MNRKKPWLENYPECASEELVFDPRGTLVKLLDEADTNYSSSEAFVNFGVSMKYEQVAKDSKSFAAYLQNVLCLRKGDRIAMMMPNLLTRDCPEGRDFFEMLLLLLEQSLHAERVKGCTGSS